MKFKKFNFVNNKYLIILFTLIVIILAIDLRFYKLSKTFTQYDDSWLYALHKGAIKDREINLNLGPIKKKITIPIEKIKELEHSFLLFPLYISFSSAYPPGQYILLPLILNKNDTYYETIFKTRSTSALSSILTLLVLIFLFYKIEKKLNWASIFVASIFAFSINSILFSHHGSVYSSSGLATACGILILHYQNNKKISVYNANILNTLLLYFSYLGVLFFIPILFLELKNKNLLTLIKEYFSSKFGYLFLNIVLILPFCLRFFLHEYPHNYARGEVSNNIFDLVIQFYLSTKSLISGFIPYNFNLYYLIIFLVLICFTVLFLSNSKNKDKRIILYCCLIYLFQWVILYSLKIIPLDQTRHSLIFFPILLTIFFIVLSEFKIINYFLFSLIIILTPFSYINSKNIINKKISLFDYNYLKNQKETHILLYDSLSALAYFKNTDKKVYYTSLNQFRKNYLNLDIPDNFLVVGHHEPFDLWAASYFKNSLPKLYDNYDVTKLIEISSKENYTYNNYISEHTWSNGFFVYRFKRKLN